MLKTVESNFKVIEKEELKVKRTVDQTLQIEQQLVTATQNPIMNPFIFPINNHINDDFLMGLSRSPQQSQRQIDPAVQLKLEEDRL